MRSAYCKNTLTLLLLCSLQIIGPDLVSSEELSCSAMAAMMKFGTKVVRGKDWSWGNQDGGPGNEGTVTGMSSPGWFIVQWEHGGSNSYRMGEDSMCDLKVVGQSPSPDVVSSDEPSCSEMASMIEVGTKVIRGKDWEWDDQDGGPGNMGTVTGNATSEGWYRVQWQGGVTNTYRMGDESKCDLKIVQETASPDLDSSEQLSCPEIAAKIKVGSRVVRGRDWEWGIQDEKPGNRGIVVGNSNSDGWYRVRWDDGDEYSYRMNEDGKCDLKIVDEISSPDLVTSEEQSCEEMVAMIKVGTKVVRGKDWRWADQDGTPPTQGTVLGTSSSGVISGFGGWVKVHWESGSTYNYRMGSENKCDLKIVKGNPISEKEAATVSSTTQINISSNVSTTASTQGLTGNSSGSTISQPSTTVSSRPESSTSQLCTWPGVSVDGIGGLSFPAAEAKEVVRLTVERARVLLEAAQSTAQAEAARAAEAVLALEAAKVSLEATRQVAKAEESWAVNAAEELELEREYRKKIADKLRGDEISVKYIGE